MVCDKCTRGKCKKCPNVQRGVPLGTWCDCQHRSKPSALKVKTN